MEKWRSYCEHGEYLLYCQLNIIRGNRHYLSCKNCYTLYDYFLIWDILQKQRKYITSTINSNIHVIEYRKNSNPEDKYTERLCKDNEVNNSDLTKLSNISCNGEIEGNGRYN